MKRRYLLPGLLTALVISLIASGCAVFIGLSGNVYGEYEWDSGYTLSTYGLSTTGGFPSGAKGNQYYEIQPGSYYFDYSESYTLGSATITYGAYYVYYTVSLDSGSSFSNASDAYFSIYCGSTGPSIYGNNASIQAVSRSVAADGSGESIYSVGKYKVDIKVTKISAMPTGSEVMTLK